MYRTERPIRRRRSRRPIVVVVLILLVASGIYLVRHFAKATETIVYNSPGVTKAYQTPSTQKQHFDEKDFAFDLAVDWKKTKKDVVPLTPYTYQSSLKNADNRYLTIWMDKLPVDRAVNKAVAVRSGGSQMTRGSASDNCVTFTNAPASSQNQLAVAAKWDGVDFLCDKDNMTRNVVGTSAPGTVNSIRLVGATYGAHTFFFTYEDNNNLPDYTIFYGMLDSFIVK